MSGPFSSPDAWNLVASGYAKHVQPMFEHFAQRAYVLLNPQDDARLLDVACGPGTAARTFTENGAQLVAIDFSEAMLEQLRQALTAGGALHGRDITPLLMDGQALQFDADSFDAAISMFGLIFFPDRHRGLQELRRVLKPGAPVCITSWFPVSEVPAMQWIFGAVAKISPAPDPDAPPRTPIWEDPETIAQEMAAAGFGDVVVQPHCYRGPMPGEDLSEFWAGMVESSAPLALLKSRVPEERWPELNAKALAHLTETRPTLEHFEMHAWIATGRSQ